MTANTEMKIFKLCKGMSITQVERRLRIVECFKAQKELTTRCKLVGLRLGE